ncbi:MAG: hypothetical protein O7G85_11120 [Planctomycetota bacterium]|nr:hypothetical protein [Planctomycetota bacterium]
MSFKRSPIVRSFPTLPMIMLTLVALAQPCSAQIGEGAGFVQALSAEFYGRDIVLFSEGLDLDETQQVIIEALFDDYMDGFEDAHANMNLRFEDMQNELQALDKNSMVRAALQPLRDLIDDKKVLREELLLSVQTVLSLEQLDRWPSFLRRMLREKSMSKGRLDGESIDLFHVIRDLDIPDSIMNLIEASLGEYEIVLDLALIAREESFNRAQVNLLNSISSEKGKVSTVEAERQVTLRVNIRDINDSFREQIASNLPGELSAEFKQLALERAYPQIYRRTLMQNIYLSALDMQGLTTEKYDAIRDMQLRYESELAPMNANMLADHQMIQPQEMRIRIESFQDRMNKQKPQRQVSIPRRNVYQRDELSNPYIESLQNLLTMDEFAALPQAQRYLQRQARLDRLRLMNQSDTGGGRISDSASSKSRNRR